MRFDHRLPSTGHNVFFFGNRLKGGAETLKLVAATLALTFALTAQSSVYFLELANGINLRYPSNILPLSP